MLAFSQCPCVTLTGSLPSEWGGAGAFPALSILVLRNFPLRGTLPASWGNASFPSLTYLQLGDNKLSGTLPPEWGAQTAFQHLSTLMLTNCSIAGNLRILWRCTALCCDSVRGKAHEGAPLLHDKQGV